MASAATGSAHHQPRRVLRPSPARVTSESHQQAVVWNESAASARLPSRGGDPALGARQPDHDAERERGDRDAREARLGPLASPQGPERVERHVGGEQEERESDQAMRAPVEPLDGRAVQRPARGRGVALGRSRARPAGRRSRTGPPAPGSCVLVALRPAWVREAGSDAVLSKHEGDLPRCRGREEQQAA
jgi:hypothetical protein